MDKRAEYSPSREWFPSCSLCTVIVYVNYRNKNIYQLKHGGVMLCNAILSVKKILKVEVKIWMVLQSLFAILTTFCRFWTFIAGNMIGMRRSPRIFLPRFSYNKNKEYLEKLYSGISKRKDLQGEGVFISLWKIQNFLRIWSVFHSSSLQRCCYSASKCRCETDANKKEMLFKQIK